MPVLVMCLNPACGELFDAPDSPPGGEVRCPVCGTVRTLAGAPGAAVPAARPEADSLLAPATTPSAPAAAPSAPTSPPSAVVRSPPAPAISSSPAPAAPAAASGGGNEPIELDLGDEPPSSRETPKPAPETPPPSGAMALEIIMEPLPEEDLLPARGKPGAKPGAMPLPVFGEGHVGAKPPPGRAASRAKAPTAKAGEEELPAEPAALDEIWNDASAGSTTELEDDIEEEAEPEIEVAEQASPSDGALSHRPAAAVVFILGLAGLAAGIAAGLIYFPAQKLLAAYLGAGLGWTAGFTFGALLVLGGDQGDARVRCPVCLHAWPAGTESCRVCGALNLGPVPDPLAIECLHAGSFALSNPSGLLAPVAMAVGGYLVSAVTAELLQAFPSQTDQWRPILIGVCAAVGYLVFSYWVAYLVSATAASPDSPAMPRKAPGAPPLRSFDTLSAGFWGLSAVAVYVLPLVMVPLLPVAMLMLGSSGKGAALNPAATARAAWRNPKGFVVLWMFLLLWLAGMTLAGIIVKVLYDLRLGLPQAEGFSGAILRVTFSSFAAAAFAVVAGIFGVAVFRCIGAFGRYSSAGVQQGKG